MEILHIYIHFFCGRRDTKPKSGARCIQDHLLNKKIGISEAATVVRRFYDIDCNGRWERIEVALKGICLGKREESSNPVNTIKKRYKVGENDEFLKLIIVSSKDAYIQGKLISNDLVQIAALFDEDKEIFALGGIVQPSNCDSSS
jgi:2,3-bisphosphoglycerate-independent phosphoglycerate mutase